MADGQSIVDTFSEIKVRWRAGSREVGRNSTKPRIRFFTLSFSPKHRELVQSAYLSFVLDEAARIRRSSRERYLYTNNASLSGPRWTLMPFSHPSTFDTLAIDPALRNEIRNDLNKFTKQQEHYRRLGRSWKRGYLLYGPPGTGKTSLIAAIANFLHFDVYDLELMSVRSNTDLRKLLASVSNKSLIVVEDIDCNLDLALKRKRMREEMDDEDEDRSSKKKKTTMDDVISLSGVLNFVDGLWSSCGGERLIIFTTNHKEDLDPALLRPGRMDKHIHLSYCGIMAFRTLAKNYLNVDDHHHLDEAAKILPSIQMTPAEIAEIFMDCSEDPDLGMTKVVEEMKKRQAAAAPVPVQKRRKKRN